MLIRVVHIVEDLKTGGLERVIADIVTGLNRQVFAPQVWCLTRGGEIFDELKMKGEAVEVFTMKSHSRPVFFFALWRKLKKAKIHIVHAHGYTGATIGRLAALLAGVPVIIAHAHSTYYYYSRKQLFIEKLFSAFTDKIICCSEAVAEFVAQKEKVSTSKIEVIYNGAEARRIDSAVSGRADTRKEFIVGCVAALAAHKGHRYVLTAAQEVINSFPQKVRFVFAGDGVLRKQLEDQAKELGIAEQAVFLGNVLDINALLATFDIVVLASPEVEGLGLSLIEAMAAGKPVVGTAVGGIREVITAGVNGILVPPKDSHGLAQAILGLLRDTKTMVSMGQQGVRIVREKFSKIAMLKRIENLYMKLLDAKQQRKQ